MLSSCVLDKELVLKLEGVEVGLRLEGKVTKRAYRFRLLRTTRKKLQIKHFNKKSTDIKAKAKKPLYKSLQGSKVFLLRMRTNIWIDKEKI